MIDILLVCDHRLDQRLRKRRKWLEESGANVAVYDEDKANWIGVEDSFERLEGLPPLNSFDLVYVSGALIFLKKFFFFLRVRLAGKVVVAEIPDLPLRYSIDFFNRIMGYGFKYIIHFVASKLVVTSEGYFRWLPDKEAILVENLPPFSIAKEIQAKSQRKQQSKKHRLVLAYVGSIRYMEQMELAVQFAILNPELVELHIYGGPISRMKPLLDKYDVSLKSVNNIKVHGPFVYEHSIANIYAGVDLLFSVYDNRQTNVRLALPNKIYEAALAKVPILVAENTYLSEVVRKYDIGYALPAQLGDKIRFNEELIAVIQNISQKKYFGFNRYQEYIFKMIGRQKINFRKLIFDAN
jgi:glycosyltransferase involved in cell wall biosynthesis